MNLDPIYFHIGDKYRVRITQLGPRWRAVVTCTRAKTDRVVEAESLGDLVIEIAEVLKSPAGILPGVQSLDAPV